MELTCWGAARSVTGSMHLLQAAGRRILLDCGLFQGGWNESFERNRNLPFNPRELDAVVLTHAHLDHSGNLPTLVKAGYDGPIYCTPATRDLTMTLLRDAAHIQEADAEYIAFRRRQGVAPNAVPLYTRADAERVCQQLIGVPYQRWQALGKWVRFQFFDAGHILGSAGVLFQAEERSGMRRLCYSGDLGRDQPRLLREREPIPETDYVLLESTYANRRHEPPPQLEDEFAQVVAEAITHQARVLIPAFAVGRTQEIVYILHRLQKRGALPSIPVFVDSPLAVDATEIYRLHAECFNAETRALVLEHQDPFGLKRLRYVRAREESVAINQLTGPCVIIAASGMCDGGRIRHHLARSVENAEHTIVRVSYQAPNTLGRRLADREERIKIFGNEFTCRARVKILNGFSGHADGGELLKWVRHHASQLCGVFLVHGQESQALAFAERLRDLGVRSVAVPQRGETFTLE